MNLWSLLYPNKIRSVSHYIVFVFLMLAGCITNGVCQSHSDLFYLDTGAGLICYKNPQASGHIKIPKSLTKLIAVGVAEGMLVVAERFGGPDPNTIEKPIPIIGIVDHAFADNQNILSVSIPDSVTSIPFGAFDGCSSLQEATIPSSVESIGAHAFAGCGLPSITIPNSVKSIGSFAFYDCYNLQEATIPSSVESIGVSAFQACRLKNVIVPNGVKSIGIQAFASNPMTKVNIPDSVTSIAPYAFDAANLKDINVSKGNADYSSENGVLFNKNKTALLLCPQGKRGHYAIPQGVIEIDVAAFSGCSYLTSIEIPNSVTSIGEQAFAHCTSLTSIKTPNSVTSIHGTAFGLCWSLKHIVFEGNAPQIINKHLWQVPSDLKIILLDNDATGFDQGFGGIPTDRINPLDLHILTVTTEGLKGEVWVRVNPPDWNGLVHSLVGDTTQFGRHYNYGDEVTLQAVKQNPELNRFKHWLANGEFVSTDPTVTFKMDNDLILQAVYESYVDPDTHILSDSAYSITGDSVTITGETVSGVLDIPATIQGKRVRKIGDNAFQGISGLKSVKIPNGVTSIGKKAFFGCSGLTSVTIPDSVNSIGKYAFQDCVNLYSVTIPDSVTIIDYATFKGCTRLAKVTIGNSVTSIGYFAFAYCNSLKSVTIPESVTRIRDEAFKYCGLNRICFKGNAPIFGYDVFIYSRLSKILITEGATGFGKTFEYTQWGNLVKIPIQILERIKINSVSKSTSPFTISFESKSGSVYSIQASHDLKRWGIIGIAQGTGSSVEFTDRRDAFIFHKQYYRVKLEE